MKRDRFGSPVECRNIENVLKTATHRLTQVGCDTPYLDAEVLLAHTLYEDRTWLYVHHKACLDKNQLDTFDHLITRREQREPVAYITGHKEFFALEFLVNSHVLIPRPETELLVELIINNEQLINSNEQLLIVDVGTGSGCIAITLAKYLRYASLLAIDVSYQALQVARQNAIRHQVLDRIGFLAGDLLAPLAAPVDLIVSNPPYVNQSELTDPYTTPEVNRYEPQSALNGGREGLETIRRLLAQANKNLKPGGSLIIEIGYNQGQTVTDLARTYFPMANIEVKKDLAGLDRVLIVQNHS
jgi:release factor glutamine methyltransferase